jgi:hypothetical protein
MFYVCNSILLTRALFSKVWSMDHQHQHCLGNCKKGRISSPIQTYWIRLCIFKQDPQVICMHVNVWERLLPSVNSVRVKPSQYLWVSSYT